MASKPYPHFLENKTIILSGAGISGLAFAISLHKLWPSISSHPVPHLILYERDPCAVPPNREGYSLSLRSDNPSAGIQTLQKMGMLDRLLEVAIIGLGGKDEEGASGVEKAGFVIWDRDWKPVMKVRSKTPPGCPVSGMRIARGKLRQELVEAVNRLPGVEIQWGNAITDVSLAEDGSGNVEVKTSKGERVEADLFIATDGSGSKLRSLLRPADILKFAGPTCIYGTTDLKHSPSGKVNEFGTIISGQGQGLFIAPVDTNSIVWCLSWHVENPHVPKKQPMPLEASRELLDEAHAHGAKAYGQRFIELLDSTDPKSVNKFNAMDKQGFSHSGAYIRRPGSEELNGRVVFLGDANHAVSPFAGNGANLALMDGWDFAESLILALTMEEALARYDKLAVGRAKRVVSMSHFSIGIMHSTGWMLWLWMWVLRVIRILFYK